MTGIRGVLRKGLGWATFGLKTLVANVVAGFNIIESIIASGTGVGVDIGVANELTVKRCSLVMINIITAIKGVKDRTFVEPARKRNRVVTVFLFGFMLEGKGCKKTGCMAIRTAIVDGITPISKEFNTSTSIVTHEAHIACYHDMVLFRHNRFKIECKMTKVCLIRGRIAQDKIGIAACGKAGISTRTHDYGTSHSERLHRAEDLIKNMM